MTGILPRKYDDMAHGCHDESDDEDGQDTEEEATVTSLAPAHTPGTFGVHEQSVTRTVESQDNQSECTPRERYTEMMRWCEEYVRAIQYDAQATQQLILYVKEKLEEIKVINKAAVATKPCRVRRQREKAYYELFSPRSKKKKK